jgi:serine/threonine-protein kinase
VSPAAPAQGRAPAPAAPPIKLEQELGKGLLGTTYRGLDTRSQRPVTVKLLRPDLLKDPQVVQRFLAEAKVARGLEHPSLVRLLGLVELEGKKAAITEYVEGFDLKTFIARNKKITVKQALDLLTNLSLAIAYAHERKLLHRDLKPTNILVGKGGKLRLTGFGLGALRLRELGRADGYPAPELLSGEAIDARSDIYSLGAVIFHALTGFHPDNEAISGNGATPQLRQLLPEAPEHLDQILARCLVRDPSARFGSTTEIAAAVRAVSV